VALRAELAAELHERYGGDSEPGAKPTAADTAVFLVARAEDGSAVGCGALRALDDGSFEIKRMYVRPAVRGTGLGRVILRALEEEAAGLGASRVVLETGTENPEAMALYASCGYAPVPCWGAYAESAISRCFGRSLEGRT
jgi:GNAT superfamily N-acetyltransferase